MNEKAGEGAQAVNEKAGEGAQAVNEKAGEVLSCEWNGSRVKL